MNEFIIKRKELDIVIEKYDKWDRNRKIEEDS